MATERRSFPNLALVRPNEMATSSELLEFLQDQLVMFGGSGLFRNGVMFGLIPSDVLFFGTGNNNRVDFESRNIPPVYLSSQKQ